MKKIEYFYGNIGIIAQYDSEYEFHWLNSEICEFFAISYSEEDDYDEYGTKKLISILQSGFDNIRFCEWSPENLEKAWNGSNKKVVSIEKIRDGIRIDDKSFCIGKSDRLGY